MDILLGASTGVCKCSVLMSPRKEGVERKGKDVNLTEFKFYTIEKLLDLTTFTWIVFCLWKIYAVIRK